MIRVGRTWAQFLQIWGQVSVVYSLISMLMLLATTYTVTLRFLPFKLPWWGYLLLLILGFVVASVFVRQIGIPGNFEYVKEKSDINKLNKKMDEQAAAIARIEKKLDEVASHR